MRGYGIDSCSEHRRKFIMKRAKHYRDGTTMVCPACDKEAPPPDVIRCMWSHGLIKVGHGKLVRNVRWFCPCDPETPYCELGMTRHLREAGDLAVHFAELRLL